MMIPTQVTMIPLFVVMNRLGLSDTYASVIMPSIFRPLLTGSVINGSVNSLRLI